MKPSAINIPNHLKISQEQFEKLALVNRDLRLERTKTGELIVMELSNPRTTRYLSPIMS